MALNAISFLVSIVVPIACSDFVLGPCYVVRLFVPFLI